uniref:Nucleolar protein 58 n=2 Tax=Lepeophtheirus salmonis TaxID=72036 RepID=A0A0K2UXE7_LEPSM
MRCIRSQISGLVSEDMKAMSLGLAHSLSRYKLKFSPDKIDTMIVQAVSLLDDLDKELNNYIMRCREWYGWHFPEMGKIVTDNIAFVRVVQTIGTREKAGHTDLSDILPEDIEEKVKAAAEISMGTEIADTDMLNIRHLCTQIVEIQEYRTQLYEYLKNRMLAVAPNVTVLVGELVGARLMSHAGSLMNLAKHPASTIQILGAEKALFKALKTKHDTPKYGLIYHAQVVGSASSKLKGKASRMLAAKVALACRVDALRDDGSSSTDLGIETRAKVEARIRQLEGGYSHKISGNKRNSQKFDKYENKSEVIEYKPAGDSTMKIKVENGNSEPQVKKIKVEDDASEEIQSEKKKKKKKRKLDEEETKTIEPSEKKKKKNKDANGDSDEIAVKEEVTENGEKKKKKKKKKIKEESD